VTGRPTVLVLRALGLGDFLTGLPAIRLLRSALPDHRRVLAAPEALRPLVELAPDVDALFAVGERFQLTEFTGRVHVGIDLHGKGPASRRLVEQLHPVRVVGFAHRPSGRPGPIWRADEHEVDRWCRLVGEAFAPVDDAPSVRGTLAVPDRPVSKGVTIVHPGAAAAARRWPASRFADVACALNAAGHDVVVTGGAREHDLAHAVAGTVGRPLVDLDLASLAALVAQARLVLCGDTGVAHLASTFGVPSVVLFGPVSPASWGPPADGPHRVIWHGDGQGNPHGISPDAALLAISVAEVLDAVTELDVVPVRTAVSISGVSR